jgi:RNA polymerase sigma-70 factor (sigma-E family)
VEFDEYVAARGAAMLRFARVLTGEQAGAEDLLQAALVDVYTHWSKVQGADRPDAYLRRVMVNRHLSWRRRRSSSELVVSPERIASSAVQEGDVDVDVAVGVADRDQARRILAALPPRARTMVVLRFYADLGDVEIAEMLGVTASTVRSTASRALSTLRAVLDAEPVPGVPHD